MRVIARLDVKNQFVIKGILLEGLRKVGDPNQLAKARMITESYGLLVVLRQIHDRFNPIGRAQRRIVVDEQDIQTQQNAALECLCLWLWQEIVQYGNHTTLH